MTTRLDAFSADVAESRAALDLMADANRVPYRQYVSVSLETAEALRDLAVRLCGVECGHNPPEYCAGCIARPVCGEVQRLLEMEG